MINIALTLKKQTTRAYVFRVHRIHNKAIQVEVQTVKIHNRIVSQDPRKTNIQTRNQNSNGQIQQKYTNIIDLLVIHKHSNLSRNGKSVSHVKLTSDAKQQNVRDAQMKPRAARILHKAYDS